MTPFDRWMAIAFPWISAHGTDYKNLRVAWDAGAQHAFAEAANRGKDGA